jgi:hypothetical protein
MSIRTIGHLRLSYSLLCNFLLLLRSVVYCIYHIYPVFNPLSNVENILEKASGF